MPKFIHGRDLTDVRTLKSMYDMDSVEVMKGKKPYRIKVTEFMKLVWGVKFTEHKSKKHTYLEVDADWLENNTWYEP